MSDYERNKGKLTKVCAVSEITEDMAKELIAVKPEYYDTFTELLTDDPWEYGYAVIGKVLYKLDREEVDNDPDYCNVTKNADGSFSFESYHYNGGAHWSELLEGKLI